MTTPIHKILCPVDFSEPSEEAVRYAVSLADRLHAEEVLLLHVYQPPHYLLPEGAITVDPETIQEIRTHLSRELEALAKRYSGHGVAVSAHLADGLPHEVIVEKVGELGASMVVMGTHGRSGLRHFILGSVAEKVVRLAPVPVCTVRAAG